MGFSFWHLLVLLLVVLILFGPGRLSRVMGDLGKGVRSMREGLKGEDEPRQISHGADKTAVSEKDNNNSINR